MTNQELDSTILSCVDAGWSEPEIQFGLGGKPWPAPEDPMNTRLIWGRINNRIGGLRLSDDNNQAVLALNYYLEKTGSGGRYKLELA